MFFVGVFEESNSIFIYKEDIGLSYMINGIFFKNSLFFKSNIEGYDVNIIISIGVN